MKSSSPMRFGSAFYMVAGTAIGSGVITFCGIGIAKTGTGAALAYVVAALALAFALSPTVALGAIAPRSGGIYTYCRELLSPFWGSLYLVAFTIGKVGLAMFCLSLVQYFCSGILSVTLGSEAERLAAFAVLTFFYVIYLLGQGATQKAQNVMTAVLILTLFSMAILGLIKCDFTGAFTKEAMFPNGFGMNGFLGAACTLVFGVLGGIGAVDYGTNIENPHRNIPKIVFIIMLGSGILNGVIALCAAVAAPVETPAAHLLAVANVIGGRGYGIFFVLCAAVLALASTILGNFNWYASVVSRGCDDGLFPKALGKTNRFGSRWALATVLYVMGILMLLINYNTSMIASMATGLTLVFQLFGNIVVLFAPSKYKEEWDKSNFPIKGKAGITIWVILSTCVLLFIIINSYMGYTTPVKIGIPCLFVVGAIYSYFNAKKYEQTAV